MPRSLDPLLTHVTMRTPGLRLRAGGRFSSGRGHRPASRADPADGVLRRPGCKRDPAIQHRQCRGDRPGAEQSNRVPISGRRSARAVFAARHRSDELSLRGVEPVTCDVRIDQAVIERLPDCSCANGRPSSRAPAGCTVRRSSRRPARCWPCARTWAGITRSTSFSAGRCSTRSRPLDRAILMVSGRLELRAGAEGGGRSDSDPGWCLSAEQPGGRAGARIRSDPDRFPARRLVQHLRRPAAGQVRQFRRSASDLAPHPVHLGDDLALDAPGQSGPLVDHAGVDLHGRGAGPERRDRVRAGGDPADRNDRQSCAPDSRTIWLITSSERGRSGAPLSPPVSDCAGPASEGRLARWSCWLRRCR